MRKGDLIWAAILAAVIASFTVPASAGLLLGLTAKYAYVMGFCKFALLATMGELLVTRIATGTWKRPRGLPARVIVWGIVGVLVVLMFTLFNGGVMVAADKGLLPVGEGWVKTLLVAFWTSALMNLTFGPVFMAAHRISDAYIDARADNGKLRLIDAILDVDWRRFLEFVVGKTIPFFWIPAHTIDFLLPPGYRVLVAAFLSIALGVILTWGKKSKAS